MKSALRPFYFELQGYLREAPPQDEDFSRTIVIVETYNAMVDKIATVTGKESEELNRFKVGIQPPNSTFRAPIFRTLEYRSKLTGFITNLHGEYFSDEAAPFAGMPSTVITQTQQQTQSVVVEMLLDIGSRVERELPNHAEGSDEKRFLTTIKDSLSGITAPAQLFSQLLSTAKDCGISLEGISSLLGF